MPKFNVQAEVIQVDPLDKVLTITSVALPADVATNVLGIDLDRKGHCVKNTGTTTVQVSYGLTAPEDVGFTELYTVPLRSGEVYLYDVAQIIPYSAKSLSGAGSISVMELG